MRNEFKVHMLNEEGKLKASEIANIFNDTLNRLEILCLPLNLPDVHSAMTREFAICKTKLEEACFFAKKSMANQPQNLQKESK